MKSFLNPANPLMFDVEGYFRQTSRPYTQNFQPVLDAKDIVRIQVPEATAGLFESYSTIEFDPYPLKSGGSGTPSWTAADPLNIKTVNTADFTRFARFRYSHIDGSVYTTPTYLVTEDQCVLNKTIRIRYYNNDRLLGGSQYPDIDYTNGFLPIIRVCGSLDSDGTQDVRNFSTGGTGISSICRAEMQPIWRLTVGPHPDWMHRKLQYVFMHQNVEVQRHGTTGWIPLVPFGTYEQTQQIGSENIWIGTGRLITDEHGVVTC